MAAEARIFPLKLLRKPLDDWIFIRAFSLGLNLQPKIGSPHRLRVCLSPPVSFLTFLTKSAGKNRLFFHFEVFSSRIWKTSEFLPSKGPNLSKGLIDILEVRQNPPDVLLFNVFTESGQLSETSTFSRPPCRALFPIQAAAFLSSLAAEFWYFPYEAPKETLFSGGEKLLEFLSPLYKSTPWFPPNCPPRSGKQSFQ